MRRIPWTVCAFAAASALVGCSHELPTTRAPSFSSALASSGSIKVVNVSNDTTAQNETPLAVNPVNPLNMITGNNDWNYNDGCGVNATFDGGKTWTPTLPNGFIPGITAFTNNPDSGGTGTYDFGGDPAVAFSPDGRTAYFSCFGYKGKNVALWLSRSIDGGRNWTPGGPDHPLTLVSAFQGDGRARGSNGQFPDHESITVAPAPDGTIYVPWAHFTGFSGHSPIYIGVSRDGGNSFALPVLVTSGSVHSDQDARVVVDPATGYAYLTFDNSILGGKGTAIYVSVSKDHGATWSKPFQVALFQNPVCLFPPYCFNISGAQFRAPGSYPAPAFDPTTRRLYVAYTDIVGGKAQIFLTYANVSDITKWTRPDSVAPASGDRINVELSVEPSSGRIDMMTNDRSYTNNTLFDVSYISSSDHGGSWTTQRVTKTSWDPSQYGVPCGSCTSGVRPFIGDYDGIVSLAGGAAMTWTGPGKTYGLYPTNLEVLFASAPAP
jgi:hypothetical protein